MQNDLEFTREMTAFFEAIPDDEWCSGVYASGYGPTKRCAMGHAVVSKICLQDELEYLFGRYLKTCVETVNDDGVGRYRQPDPKLRVLAALKDIEEKILAQADGAIQSESALQQAKQIINEPAQELCSK